MLSCYAVEGSQAIEVNEDSWHGLLLTHSFELLSYFNALSFLPPIADEGGDRRIHVVIMFLRNSCKYNRIAIAYWVIGSLECNDSFTHNMTTCFIANNNDFKLPYGIVDKKSKQQYRTIMEGIEPDKNRIVGDELQVPIGLHSYLILYNSLL